MICGSEEGFSLLILYSVCQ